MQTYTKFGIALALAFISIFLEIYREFSNRQGIFASDMLAVPVWTVVGAVFLMTFCVIVFLKFLWDSYPSDLVNQTKYNAVQIASKRWKVMGASVYNQDKSQILKPNGWHQANLGVQPGLDGHARVNVKLVDSGITMTLPFCKNHPSIDEIKHLSFGDRIEFEFQRSPIDCAYDTDLCAYLKVKIPREA